MESPFWLFSLSVYASPGVQRECIELQDKFGVDVNLLLFAAFVGSVHGALLPQDELSAAMCLIGQWQGEVVRALREARRSTITLVSMPVAEEALVTGLRNKIKSIELEAERIEQIVLEAWLPSRVHTWPCAEPSVAVTNNIRTLLALCSEQQIVMPTNLIAAAVRAHRRPTSDQV